MGDLVIVTIPARDGMPRHTVQMTTEDAERYYQREGQQAVPVRVEAAQPVMVRVEIEPGHFAQMTPDEAARWRERRDKQRAAEAAVALRRQTGPTIPGNCGVVLLGENDQTAARIAEMGLPCQVSAPSLPYEFNLLWEPSAPLRLDLMPAGFHLISRFPWQMAVPLWSYDELARDIGTPEDRERTEAICRDLRVPAYDCRVVFLRRCVESEQLLAAWQEEADCGADLDALQLAFLRALYQVKPLICALPAGTWVG